jgi:hypothetical protein
MGKLVASNPLQGARAKRLEAAAADRARLFGDVRWHVRPRRVFDPQDFPEDVPSRSNGDPVEEDRDARHGPAPSTLTISEAAHPGRHP